jgi:hygromycin-B 4-O-kinase
MMTDLTVGIVSQFLQANFHRDIASVQWIGSGWFSHAFSFIVGEQAFIFRVNSYLEDLQKDDFAYQHYASAQLPIPRVILIGKFDVTRHFCIAERCPGRTLSDMDEASIRKVVPQLFETLDAIHRVNVSGYVGWGLTGANGNGHFDSWTDYLLSLSDQKFMHRWSTLQQHTFWEKDVHEAFFEEMKPLLPYCSSDRCLIHRDYGFDNVMTDRHTITGVLDWADCGLGDFVFDIAWLDFFSQEIPYGELWNDYAAAKGYDVPNLHERMRCYMLWIGLDSMASVAVKENERSYIRHRERTRSVLLPARRSDSDWTQ